MGLDRAGLSPRLLQKVVYAGSNATSCKQARAFLKELAGYDCKERFILRTCHRIGHEAPARDLRVAVDAGNARVAQSVRRRRGPQ